MKEILNSRVVYYVGFTLLYILSSKFIGFETTILLCMGYTIGEQAYLANQNKDETRDDLLNLNPQKTSTPPLQKSKDLKDFERQRKKWKEQTKYLRSKTWKWW